MGRISTYRQVSIDEFSFVINPVLPGTGKNAFAGIDTAELDLSEAHSFKRGVVSATQHRR